MGNLLLGIVVLLPIKDHRWKCGELVTKPLNAQKVDLCESLIHGGKGDCSHE